MRSSIADQILIEFDLLEQAIALVLFMFFSYLS